MGSFGDRQDEDCLELTVWTPGMDERKRPVVIWLHGGAWQSGGGALDWYNGSHLAAMGDVVVVSPNYRLGALGWLYLDGEVANLGLLDQELAIDWVVENIAAFGGDPEQITVMGQSAGGACIAALLMRRPRFQRAIIQSASLGRGFWPADIAGRLGRALLQAAGVSTLKEARALPAGKWLKAQQAPQLLEILKSGKSGRAMFCPVVDGHVIAENLDTGMEKAASQVDVLIGYTHNEMAAFPGFEDEKVCRNATEAVFGARSMQWAQMAGSNGRGAWAYRFDYGPNPRYGACHCIELPFVFGTLDAFATAPMLDGGDWAHMQSLAASIQQAWIAFLRGRAPWQPYPHIQTFA